jgi:hypothetical protein
MIASERLEIVAQLPNLLCHEYTAEGLLVSRRNRLFKIRDLGSPRLEAVGSVPWGPKQWPAYVRTIDRVLKAGIQLALRVDSRRQLVAARERWWLLSDGHDARDLGELPVGRPMARGICVSKGTIYLAEYRPNPQRGPVHILRGAGARPFEVAWRFPARTIRHVHALIPDPERSGRIWVLTGDFDHESSIWYTDDGFEHVHHHINLGQRTRATDLICLPERLVWGMDSPLESPYIMELPRSDPAVARPLHRLDGPAYYTARNDAGGCYVGTTVEPGPAVCDRVGRLYAWAPGDEWREAARWRHARVPQYGIVNLPRGVLPATFVACSARALSPGEGHLTIARDRALESPTRGERPLTSGDGDQPRGDAE